MLKIDFSFLFKILNSEIFLFVLVEIYLSLLPSILNIFSSLIGIHSFRLIQNLEIDDILKNNKNSFIAKDFPELVYFIEHIDAEKIKEYSSSARDYASQNLRMSRMIGNALNSLNFLSTKEGE